MSRLTLQQEKYLGRYTSAQSFVDHNNLQAEAVKVLGKTWRDDGDDISQIDDLLEHIRPNGFRVMFLKDCKFEDDIEVRETDSFTTDPVYIWFNNFVDYVQDNNPNFYNHACEYADKLENNE